MGERIAVLVAAGGADWETDVLARLDRADGMVLQKRCVDLTDLLASAGTGLAGAAVVAGNLAGLDADSVDRLTRSGVRVLVVSGEADPATETGRLARLGAERVLGADDLGLLGELLAGPAERTPAGPGPDGQAAPAPSRDRGRLTVVWGPAGAPGRTTVAVAVAAAAAQRGAEVLLVDADPYAGAVAQHLGVLDEVSGLLAAARLGNAGRLDPERLAGLARQVAPRLRVLTGLPRADRWAEVRAAAWDEVLDAAVALAGQVVVDVGFCLEDAADPYGGPRRNGLTLGAAGRADEVLVVGAADPVGLARLARALVEVRDLLPGTPLRVVVNRMRPSLGWSEKEVAGMVEGFVGPAAVHFLPEARAAADRALMAGGSLLETGDATLRAAVTGIVDGLLGEQPGPRRRFRRPARRQAPNSR